MRVLLYCVAEENRIYKAGGWVEFNRVNGNLALSRAIGDFIFKSNRRLKPEEQIITGVHLSLSLPPTLPFSPLSLLLSLSLTHVHAGTHYSCNPSSTCYTILADPEIITSEIHTKDEFVVLACDGKCPNLSHQWLVPYIAYYTPGTICLQVSGMSCPTLRWSTLSDKEWPNR